MFGLVHNHRLTFDSSQDVGGGVTSFAFRADRSLGALAGQHGILALSLTARKPFSLASAPEEDLVLIGTSLSSGSAFKTKLAALQPGASVTLRGPVNTFTLDDSDERVVMLAQGVGITPMRAMLAHASLTGRTLHTSLVHVANTGHAYRNETEQWATTASYPEHADAFRSLVGDLARGDDATYFVAGASGFVSATTSMLREHGVAKNKIREDKYLFYKPQQRV